MNKRFVGVLLFAFVVALGFSTVFYRLLVHQSQTANAARTTVRIVLATKDLDVGTILKDEDVKVEDWPGAVPAGATARAQDVVGRGVTTAIYAREPIIESRLAPKGAGGGLAAMIPQGMRAVAIRVNEVVGVSGFVVSVCVSIANRRAAARRRSRQRPSRVVRKSGSNRHRRLRPLNSLATMKRPRTARSAILWQRTTTTTRPRPLLLLVVVVAMMPTRRLLLRLLPRMPWRACASLRFERL